MKKSILLIVIVLIIGFITWFFFKTDYVFHNYKLESCDSLNVTVVEYSKIGQRGLVFIYGLYNEKEIPNANCIVNPAMSGFDSYFECVVTCERGIITVNYYEGYFDPKYTSNNIISKRVHTDTYDSLRNLKEGKLIKIY